MQKIKSIFNKLKENKSFLATILGVFILLLLCGGVTFAIFSYSNEASNSNIDSGYISFTYTEPSNQYIVKDALPMKDGEAMGLSDYFEFSVTTTAKTDENDDTGVSLPYEITITESEGNTLNSNQIKMYLTEVEGEKEIGHIVPTLVSNFEPSLYKNVGTKIGFKLHLHKNGNETITTKYRLRAWIDFDVDATNWYKEDKQEYKFRVNVNGEATYQGYHTDLSCFTFEKYTENNEEFYQILGYDFNKCDSKNIVVPSYIQESKTTLFKEIEDITIIDEEGFNEIYIEMLFEQMCSGYDDIPSCLAGNNATQEDLDALLHDYYTEFYDYVSVSSDLVGQNYYDFKKEFDEFFESEYYLMGLVDIKFAEEKEIIDYKKIKVNKIVSFTNTVVAVSNEKNINVADNLNNVVGDYKDNAITIADDAININSIVVPDDISIKWGIFSEYKINYIYEKSGNFPKSCFEYNSVDGKVNISDYNCAGVKNLRIPSYIDGNSVTSIGSDAFKNKNIETILFANSLTSIGNSAFAYNNLRMLTLPNNISIGNNAFAYNSLEYVLLPDNVSITGVESESVFYGNTISKIENEDGKFSNSCFLYAEENGTVVINGNLCYGAINIEIPNTINGIVVSKIANSVYYLDNLETVILNDGLQVIGHSAFDNNNLKKIIIPDSVVSIGNNAFNKNSIEDLKLGSNVQSILNLAFANNKISVLELPNSLIEINEQAFIYNNIYNLVIPDSVITIGKNAFAYNKLKSLKIGSGLKTIGEYCFYSNDINQLILPDNVTSIGHSAFEFNELTKVVIGNGITELAESIFQYNKIKSLKLSEGLTVIGSFTFARNSLSSVDLPDSLVEIGQNAFFDNELSSVVIPDSVTTLSAYAFKKNKIKNITFGTGVTVLKSSVFENNLLTNVTIPDIVTRIDDGAFENNRINTLDLGNGVTYIGSSAFAYNNLTEIVIPSQVTNIGNSAFYKRAKSNEGLTKIINRPGLSLRWSNIFNSFSSSAVSFDYGTVTNSLGNVEIVAE